MTSECKAVQGITVDDTVLTGTSLSEADATLWTVGATFGSGDEVMLTTGYHRIYKSLQAGNIGHHPETDPDSASWWQPRQPTNAWAPFDRALGTRMVGPSGTSYTFRPGRINTFAALEADAVQIQLVMVSDSDGEVYNQVHDLPDVALVSDWYSYFFEPIERATVLVITDLPIYGDATLTVTFLRAGGDIGCGLILLGQFINLGFTQWGASSGFIDYSVNETDEELGITTLEPRGYSEPIDVVVEVPSNRVSAVKRRLISLRATPVLFLGAGDQYECLIGYGTFIELKTVISNLVVSTCTVSFRGLTNDIG